MKVVGRTGFSRWQWTIELLQMRRRLLPWIRSLFCDRKTAILINGEPGRWMKIRRMHQGDPLSLILFIMAVDILPSLLKFAAFYGIIEGLVTSEILKVNSPPFC